MDFDEQLEGRLKEIQTRRSHKKILKPVILQNDLQLYSMIEQNIESDNVHNGSNNKHSQNSAKIRPSAIAHNRSAYSLSSLTENSQILQFLSKNFPGNIERIELNKFMEKMIFQSRYTQNLTDNELREVYMLLRDQLTTTQPNEVSLNALQVTLKNRSLTLHQYFSQTIHSASLIWKKKELEFQQMSVKKQLKERKKNLREKQDRYQERIETLKKQQQAVHKKQQELAKKEKQLGNKLKAYKQILQEKNEKLLSHSLAELQALSQKVQKKINTCERNMKYKIENLSRKVNQIHQLRQYSQDAIRKSVTVQLKAEKKRQEKNQVQKLQKEQREKNIELNRIKEEKESLEEESEKLLKICSNLQSKISKLQKKLKNALQDNQSLRSTRREIQNLHKEKEYEIEQLNKILMAYEQQSVAKENNKHKNKTNTKNGKHLHISLSTVVCLYEQIILVSLYKKSVLEISIQEFLASVHICIEGLVPCNHLLEVFTLYHTRNITQLKQKQSNMIVTSYTAVAEYLNGLETAESNYQISKYKKNISSQPQQGWKLCISLMLIEGNPIRYQQCFNMLLSALEVPEMLDQFVKQLKTNNYLLVIIQKTVLISNQFNEKNNVEYYEGLMNCLMDLILSLEITASKEQIRIIVEYEVYRRVIWAFIALAAPVKQSDFRLEVLEKISIILQRILYFYGRDIRVESEERKVLRNIYSRYQKYETILVPNIENIIEIVEGSEYD